MAFPSADSFNALGAGNGFPVCVPKLNLNSVSGLVNYLAMDLDQAMSTFWNVGQIVGKATAGFTLEDSGSSWTVFAETASEAITARQPKERVCLPIPATPTPILPILALSADSDSEDTGTEIFGTIRAFATMGISQQGLRRFYTGDVNDEDNFVGWGYWGESGPSSPNNRNFAWVSADTSDDDAGTREYIRLRISSIDRGAGPVSQISVGPKNAPMYLMEEKYNPEEEVSASFTSFGFWTYP